MTNSFQLGFVSCFTRTSHIWMCLIPQNVAHELCCHTFGFFACGWKWYFNVVLICISFIISEVPICLNAIWYLFLYQLFSYCCWSFSPLFLRALYILFVILSCRYFLGWSCMFWFTDGGVFCPLKIFLILCNHFYLFVYSLCILSQS